MDQVILGSNPRVCIRPLSSTVEHSSDTREVGGSNPSGGMPLSSFGRALGFEPKGDPIIAGRGYL